MTNHYFSQELLTYTEEATSDEDKAGKHEGATGRLALTISEHKTLWSDKQRLPPIVSKECLEHTCSIMVMVMTLEDDSSPPHTKGKMHACYGLWGVFANQFSMLFGTATYLLSLSLETKGTCPNLWCWDFNHYVHCFNLKKLLPAL
ncbi:hypothetical protein MTR_5g006815 [Medicago truncatula]|uniref:Uncharacterized protein n=1 Tax=Medicago truncatula TaxID=3880 RepID=A0A072UNG1_MEDTR|nr:hypothetical protein MTR_5g006815 [Medicago truncatula]